MTNKKDIQQLIDRYLDGTTSCEEEALLRHYFQTLDVVPNEWRPIRAMMNYADSERAACTTTTSMPRNSDEQHARLNKETHGKTWAHVVQINRKWWAAAAIGMLLTGTTWTLWSQQAEDKCYAIIDGQHVTDDDIVEQEAERALQLVAISDEEALEALDTMN